MNHLAFLSCAAANQAGWLPFEQLRLPVDDLGFRQGVTAVERMRTYSGEPFLIDRHLKRFEQTLRLISIHGIPDTTELKRLIQELMDRNRDTIRSCGDVGITMWATPGNRSGQESDNRPTLALHLNPIDHEAVDNRRIRGQTVVLTDVLQPDSRCWSRQAKVRNRLHYYLADVRANEIAKGATGLLQDADGSWTESSLANIALVSGNTLLWPPSENVLPGVSQTHVRELADAMGVDSHELPITTKWIRDADAMLCMGTDTGLWFANQVFGHAGELLHSWSIPTEASMLRRLQSQW